MMEQGHPMVTEAHGKLMVEQDNLEEPKPMEDPWWSKTLHGN